MKRVNNVLNIFFMCNLMTNVRTANNVRHNGGDC